MPEDLTRSYYLSRARVHHGCVLAGFLIVLAVLFLFIGEPAIEGAYMISVMLLAMSAFVFVNLYRMTRNKGPRLTIGPEGVWYHEWKVPHLPWRQIADVFQTGSRVQAFLALPLRDPDGYFRSLSDEEQRQLKGNRLLKKGVLLIPNSAVSASLGEIEAAVKQARDHFIR